MCSLRCRSRRKKEQQQQQKTVIVVFVVARQVKLNKRQRIICTQDAYLPFTNDERMGCYEQGIQSKKKTEENDNNKNI